MATKRISELTAGGPVTGTDLVEIETASGASRKQPMTELLTYFSSLLSSTWGAINGTLADQTDLVTALNAKLDDTQLDTDISLAANSDTKIATQKAVKTYVDAASGDLAFIQRIAFTTAANVDIALPSGYDSFKIEFYLTVSVDGTGLDAAFTSDNFSSILSGATDYAYTQLRSAASAASVTSSNGTSIISLAVTATLGNAAGEFAAGTIEILNSKETAPTNADCRMNYVTAAAAYGASRTMSSYKPTTTINGIRLTPLSGTVTGFYKIWGLVA